MTLAVKDANEDIKYISYSGLGTESQPFRAGPGDGNLVTPTLYEYMDSIGDGLGNTNMNAVGSLGAPAIYYLKPPPGTIYRVARLILSLRDTGSFDSGGWGSNGGSPLTNGIRFQAIWDGSVNEFSRNTVKSHFDIAALCHDVAHHEWGSGDEFLTARLTFTKAGRYLAFDGDKDDHIKALVQDDLSYLVDFRCSFQGHIIVK